MTEKETEFIKAVFSGDSSGHDFYHTVRVYKLATQIAEHEKADVKTVQLAALLHDVDDIKLSPDTYSEKKNAVSFMTAGNVDRKTIEAVCKIIDSVSFVGTDSQIPETIEGKCVQDADRLDAMGAIGIARTFAYGGSKGRAIYDPEIKPKTGMSKEEYRNNENSTSINHFYEKLLLLESMMNTSEGRRLAKRRMAVMQEFLDEFIAEWNGER
ncbi:MAG: HD domain-containing protein [Oscillospiraceae bacterium]|nr:HD domain-containing protein [Oscillospiraceae bacterium]